MKLNRAVIKQQAKDIIKGNILKLFFISFIIGILAGGSVSYNVSDVDDFKDFFNKDKNSYSDSAEQDGKDPFNFDEFTTEYDENFFDEFGGKGMVTTNKGVLAAGVFAGVFAGAMSVLSLLYVAKGLFLGPLSVMLDGLYWQLIKGNNMDLTDGFGFVFKKTFDKNYWNKFFLNFLKSLLLGLLYCLFIIPGVIFTYKWYFASYIMAEKPELKFDEAIKISDKMTKGHKWELFVMDLSFFGWYLLLIPTLGILSIYITPYVSTTHALYYENFKLRAFQEGALTQYDFMTAKEKVYANQVPMQAPDCFNYAHSLPDEAYRVQYGAPAPVQPVQENNTYYQPTAAPAQPVQQNTYYQPSQPVQPAEPVQPVQPVQPAEPVPQAPAEPVIPAEPVAPAEPEMPAEPAAPAEPEYYTPSEPTQGE